MGDQLPSSRWRTAVSLEAGYHMLVAQQVSCWLSCNSETHQSQSLKGEVMTFKDKVALITGGGTGIGKATAERLVALGANVIINGRREDVLAQAASQIDKSGKKAIAIAGDIANPAIAQRLVDTALRHFGGVDILINNAGIFKPTPFLEHTADDVNSYLDIILKGTFF